LLLLLTASIKAKIAAKINFQAENGEDIKRHLARSRGIAVAVVVSDKKIWLRARWVLWSPRERYAYLWARADSHH